MSLKSPGIRPKGLPGKHHPNPLPKIRSSQSKEDGSPLVSPSFGSPVAVFRQSPVSTPVTPSYQTSPRESDSSLADPIKHIVILPHNNVQVSNSVMSLPPFPPGKPPPLPPKPRHAVGETPPLPPRDVSPPPPIPPRLGPARPSERSAHQHSHSHRSPLESRPPQMDPVFPQQSVPPSVLPRQTDSLSRPPSSLPHSASWLPTSSLTHNGLAGLAPLSAGPEIGSHFTFGPHTVSPQLPPRPSRTTSTPR